MKVQGIPGDFSKKKGFPWNFQILFGKNPKKLPWIFEEIPEKSQIPPDLDAEVRKFSNLQNATPTGNHGKPLFSISF